MGRQVGRGGGGARPIFGSRRRPGPNRIPSFLLFKLKTHSGSKTKPRDVLANNSVKLYEVRKGYTKNERPTGRVCA